VHDKLGHVTEKRDVAYNVTPHSGTGLEPAQLVGYQIGKATFTSSNSAHIVGGEPAWYKHTVTIRLAQFRGLRLGTQTVTVTHDDYNSGTVTESQTVADGQISVVFVWTTEDFPVGIDSIKVTKNTASGSVEVANDNPPAGTLLAVFAPNVINTSFSGVVTLNGGATTLNLSQSAARLWTLPVASINGGADGTYTYSFTINESGNVIIGNTGVYDTYAGTFVISGGVITSVSAPTSGSSIVPKVVQTLDRWGNTLTSTDPSNASWITSYLYDYANRAVKITQPSVNVLGRQRQSLSSQPIQYAYYDLAGQKIGERTHVTSASPTAAGSLHRWFYDAAGELIKEQDSTSGLQQHVYDALGHDVQSLLAKRQPRRKKRTTAPIS